MKGKNMFKRYLKIHYLNKKNLFFFLISVVSKAFQVLSDPQKRTFYDNHGEDPDSRNHGIRSEFNGARFSDGTFFTNEILNNEMVNICINVTYLQMK